MHYCCLGEGRDRFFKRPCHVYNTNTRHPAGTPQMFVEVRRIDQNLEENVIGFVVLSLLVEQLCPYGTHVCLRTR